MRNAPSIPRARQAENIGPNARALCQRLFDKRGREAQKSMWGIVAIAPRLPARIVEQAATVALARLEADIAPPLTQQHELIREPTEYAEFLG